MLKIESISELTNEELSKLSKKAINPILLKLFDSSTRILHFGSIGDFMHSIPLDNIKYINESKRSSIELPDIIENIKKSSNIILAIIKLYKYLYAIFISLILYNIISYQWFKFFLLDSEFKNEFIAKEFYLKLKKSRKHFFLGKISFKMASNLLKKYNDLQLIHTKIQKASDLDHESISSNEEIKAFNFNVIIDYELFYRFSKELEINKVIDKRENFINIFYGFKGEMVNWNYNSESLIFLMELLRLKKIIESKIKFNRSKIISICFYDQTNCKNFNPDSLNTLASEAKLSKFNHEKLTNLIKSSEDIHILKIYQIYKNAFILKDIDD